MKPTKKGVNIEDIRNSSSYKKSFDTVDARLRLAIEINEKRKCLSITQQELSRIAGTTQKVISKIESGDMNLGFDLLNRITKCLDLRLQIGETIFSGDPIQTNVMLFPIGWSASQQEAFVTNDTTINE